jgi:hypothetical protein
MPDLSPVNRFLERNEAQFQVLNRRIKLSLPKPTGPMLKVEIRQLLRRHGLQRLNIKASVREDGPEMAAQFDIQPMKAMPAEKLADFHF